MANRTSIKSTKVAKKAAAKRGAAKAAKPRKTVPKSQSRKVAKPALLAGGNPQIAKADGDAPVQAYIAGMPGWKRTEPIEGAVRAGMRSRERATGKPASRLIDQRIRDLGGWRGETLARMRALILEADPEMTEEWKWMGTPVWSHHGIVCTGEAYTKVVKLTFAKGARLPDPARLFNSSLEGNTRRAIDIHEGEQVDERAFKALIKAAVVHNRR